MLTGVKNLILELCSLYIHSLDLSLFDRVSSFLEEDLSALAERISSRGLEILSALEV